MPEEPLATRVLEYARDSGSGDFERLALEIFERQFETLPAYREHCAARGATPAAVRTWTEIPAIEPASTGEKGPEPPVGSLSALDPAALRSLLRLALPGFFASDRLRLVVGAQPGANPGAFLLEELGRDAPPDSLIAGGRVDAKRLRSWLAARQRDRRPVSVISDLAGFESLLGILERRAVKFRLPPGSRATCAVSFEAVTASSSESWGASLLPSLGLAPDACRRVLVGSEAATPLLEHPAPAAGRFRLPHWVRAAPIEPGRLALFDLACLDTPPRLLETGSLEFV